MLFYKAFLSCYARIATVRKTLAKRLICQRNIRKYNIFS